MAGGWFFLMISEAFQLGQKDFRLPGLGSYMSVAAAQGNFQAMLWAIIAMVVLIVFLDQLLWQPLIIWSQKFRVEDVSSQELFHSWFLNILKNSWILSQANVQLQKIPVLYERYLQQSYKKIKIPYISGRFFNRLCLISLLFLLAIGLFFLAQVLYGISFKEWARLSHLVLLTFLRVTSSLLIGVAIAIPLGLFIGSSTKYSQYLQSLIQITASFPATLLFPILIWIFKTTGLSLEISSIILMLTGTLWYVLFNVIAGAKAIPEDLKEVAISFKFSKLQKLLKLQLPIVFPYLITGMVAGSGGAWNASIVAEYLSYNGHISTVPGIGSSISLAAQKGDIPLLLASLTLMVAVVVCINYVVWLKLYHYSEKRFALNY
jgi:NitT/TauT family transport system permease protein